MLFLLVHVSSGFFSFPGLRKVSLLAHLWHYNFKSVTTSTSKLWWHHHAVMLNILKSLLEGLCYLMVYSLQRFCPALTWQWMGKHWRFFFSILGGNFFVGLRSAQGSYTLYLWTWRVIFDTFLNQKKCQTKLLATGSRKVFPEEQFPTGGFSVSGGLRWQPKPFLLLLAVFSKMGALCVAQN